MRQPSQMKILHPLKRSIGLCGSPAEVAAVILALLAFSSSTLMRSMSREDLNIQSSLMLPSASRSARLPRGQCSTTRAKIPESKNRPRYRFMFSCRISRNWTAHMERLSPQKRITCFSFKCDFYDVPKLVFHDNLMFTVCASGAFYLTEEILGVVIDSWYRLSHRNLLQPNPVALVTRGPIRARSEHRTGKEPGTGDLPPGFQCWSSQVLSGCNCEQLSVLEF